MNQEIKPETKKEFTLPPKKVEEKIPTPFGRYKDIRGRAIIRANGSKMVKVDSIYTPENEEEEALCKYFEKLGYLQPVK